MSDKGKSNLNIDVSKMMVSEPPLLNGALTRWVEPPPESFPILNVEYLDAKARRQS